MRRLAVLLAVSALGGCEQGCEDASKGQGTPAASASATVPARAGSFPFDLYMQVRDAKKNFVFAPAPIAASLGLLHPGAKGATAKEMTSVLRLGPDARSVVERQAKALAAHAGPDGMLVSLNRVWVDEGVAVVEGFGGDASSIAKVDFRTDPEAARGVINAWARQQSKGRLDEAVWKNGVDEKTRLVVTAGAYFHPQWKTPFDPSLTKRFPFEYAFNREGLAVTMRTSGTFPYAKLQHLEVLDLPCKDSSLAMTILLPKRRYPLFQLAKSLKLGKLNGWLDEMKPTKLEVFLPKFTVSTHTGLTGSLLKLGMTTAFGPEADFSGFVDTKKPVGLGEVAHHAVVQVDEGTSAKPEARFVASSAPSAASQPSPAGSGKPATQPFEARRPFVFLVRDTKSGSILFVGQYTRP